MNHHDSNLSVGRLSRLKRWLIRLPIAVGIYVGLIFLYIHPHKPTDLVGWLLLFFFGIPVSGFLEWFGDRFLISHKETNASLGLGKKNRSWPFRLPDSDWCGACLLAFAWFSCPSAFLVIDWRPV